MNTPITDKAAFDVEATGWDNTIEKNRWPNGDYVESGLARRLELDRAALMEALETATRRLDLDDDSEETEWLQDDWQGAVDHVRSIMLAALAAALANFP